MTTTSSSYTSYVSGTLSGTTFTPSSHFTTAGVFITDSGSGFQPGDPVMLSGSISTTGTYLGYVVSDGSTYILVKSTTNSVDYLFGAPSTGQTYQIDTTDTLSCYVEGTRIATASGDRAIESLAVGDLVRAGDGALHPIVWVGHRRVNCRQHPRQPEVWPIRVMAGAFKADSPARDLFLSPDHAVFTDGVLIPIKHLINGATIVSQPCDAVTYWHVELERHDVLLAEGLLCESYLDNGGRNAFANGGPIIQLHPNFSPAERCEAIGEAAGYAPLRITGEVVERVRARLGRRAVKLGYAANPIRQVPHGTKPVTASIDLAALCQPEWYLANYPDVSAADVDPRAHYATHGRQEGRSPCPEATLIRALGLIDAATIIRTMPDVVAAGADVVEHFCAHGWRESRRPNAYFDPVWYKETHDVPAGINPLAHYVLLGECQGLAPSRHFDPTWYRQHYQIAPSVCALAHYLQHRRTQQFSPLPSFSVLAYAQSHRATLRPNRDPYLHFLALRPLGGDLEGRAAA